MKWTTLIAIGAVALLSALAAVLAHASEASPVATSQIVFQSDRDGDSEIWLMDLDGSGLRQLTTNTFADATPVWTPTGEIVFASTRNGNWDLYRMDENGKNVVRLTSTAGASEFDPAVSIAGDVAFEGDASGNWDVYVLPSDGSDQVQMTDSSANDFDPSFSPDGRTIAFATGDRGTYDIATVDVGGGPNDVNIIPMDDVSLVFDPHFLVTDDETQIVMSYQGDAGKDNPNRNVAAMNLGGGDFHTLTNAPTDDWGPTVTADNQVVFTRSVADRASSAYQLFIMDDQGGNQRRLTSAGRGINVEADVRPVAPAAAQRSLAWVRGLTSSAACITGTAGSNNLSGSLGNNCINGLAGDDRLDGRAGNDTIHGGAGDDIVLGGLGLDSLYGDSGDDVVSGGAGNDRIWGDAGEDTLLGQAAADRLFAVDGEADEVTGGAGAGDEAFVDENIDDVDPGTVIH